MTIALKRWETAAPLMSGILLCTIRGLPDVDRTGLGEAAGG